MKAAAQPARAAGYELSLAQNRKTGPFVHYRFGTGMGALYGGIVELGPRELRRHPLVSSIGFGSLLFAGR